MNKPSLKAPAPDPRFDAAVTARLESLLGIDPRTTLDKLRDAQQVTSNWRRREAEQTALLATYEARYGFPSHWEHERKALLSRLSQGERDRSYRNGEKITESALDEYSHAHSEYRSFLEAASRDRVEMERLRAEVARIRAEIDIAKGVETYYERHARLNDALVYFGGKEMGLS